MISIRPTRAKGNLKMATPPEARKDDGQKPLPTPGKDFDALAGTPHAGEPAPVKPAQDERICEVSAWPDAWLVEAVRRDPPSEAALQTLADRYWRPLFGRCQLLTLNHEKACDLTQEAWCRVLRARHGLKPDGNFPAYLATTALNIWRDWQRSARREGQLANHRVASLNVTLRGDEGEPIVLADLVLDPGSLDAEKQNTLRLDLDQALEQLLPQLREVLVARFLVGESCAQIGRRHGRTEQTVSAWVRQALREMKSRLEGTSYGPASTSES